MKSFIYGFSFFWFLLIMILFVIVVTVPEDSTTTTDYEYCSNYCEENDSILVEIHGSPDRLYNCICATHDPE